MICFSNADHRFAIQHSWLTSEDDVRANCTERGAGDLKRDLLFDELAFFAWQQYLPMDPQRGVAVGQQSVVEFLE